MENNINKAHRMDSIDNVIRYLFTFLTWFAIIAAVYLAVITVTNVFLRSVFNYSIMAAIDTSQLSLAIIALGSLPVVTMFNGHIKVDLIVNNFSKKGQDIMSIINFLICSSMMLVMSYFTFIKTFKMYNMGTTSSAIAIPYWPFYLIVAVMLLFAGFCGLYNIVHLLVTGETVTPMTFEEVKQRMKEKKGGQAK